MKDILILGAGGHALNVIDLLLNEQDEFKPAGILDPQFQGEILGVSVIGKDDSLLALKRNGIEYAFPAVGFGEGINNGLRKKIFEQIKRQGFKIPNLISSRSFIRSGVSMGEGNLIQAGSVIDSEVELGSNIAIGFNTLIGHRSKISDHVTFSGGVILNGGVRVGEGTFLGMGCILFKDVGAWSKVSPGTVCLEPVSERSIAFDNPMRYVPNLQKEL